MCQADRVAPDDPAEAIVPDDKDWTWVLDRPCDECGFEAAAVPREQLGERFFVAAEEWVQILSDSPAVEVRPAPAVWSPLEYGCHVRDVHRTMRARVVLMRERDTPTFENWDQDATAVEDRYGEQEPSVVAAELLGASMGLGWLLTDSQNNGRTDRLLLAIVLLAVLGKATDALLGVFEKWAAKKWA